MTTIRRGIRCAFLLGCALVVAACGGGGGGGSTGGTGGDGGGSGNPPPATITQIKLTSDPGDYIGQGSSYAYSKSNSIIELTANGGLLVVAVRGEQSWVGSFQLPRGYTSLAAGTWVGLSRYPFHDPVIGGLNWSGDGRGCNGLSGSFTIDKVTYENNALTEVSLKFTQHCEGSSPALHGEIYWNAKDTTRPAGPTAIPAGLWAPAAGTTPATGSFVYLESQSGDYIGLSASYLYTQLDAMLYVSAAGGHLSVAVDGDQQWSGDFEVMNSRSTLEAGYYGDLSRFPFHNPTRGGLSWTGEGRGCNTLKGWFAVDRVVYSAGVLAAIELRFAQYCGGSSAALHGAIRWNRDDSVTLPGPTAPPPGLWQPATGATPSSGNYVYLDSSPGDYIGMGRDYLYDQATASIALSSYGNRVSVWIAGDEDWDGTFKTMNSLGRLEPGYYGNLSRYPFNNPVRGGLTWSGEARGCNALSGWFVVDRVIYSGDTLVALDLRFEQWCDNSTAPLRGQVHWEAGDTTSPPGPTAPPAGLWQPSPDSIPASGNYVYLESEPGDYVGGGQRYLYTQRNSVLSASLWGRQFSIGVEGDELWSGNFEAMNSLQQLEVGYYGDLQRFGFHNPTKGGLDWSGQGRGCNTVSGWFVVDDVVYTNSTLTSIDLRFELHCDGMAPALRGSIHWDASDHTTPPGPTPPPPGLWQPAAGTTPSSGNYVYLESDYGDFVGNGQDRLYTQTDALLNATVNGSHVSISVIGDASWGGDFQAMNSLARLEPGYYGDMTRYPFHNPTKGGMSWHGDGRGCNTLSGWFVVDDVQYSGSALTSIDLRFEQHCEGKAPALRGRIHWDASDTTSPPGPTPPSPDLWRAAPGQVPASGNYVYLQSDPYDYIGGGGTYLYTPQDTQIETFTDGGRLQITVGGPSGWTGNFQAMSSVARLEAGYYGDLRRYPFHNPAKGGLDWSGQSRGCNTLNGWFVVDDVVYAGTTLLSIDLRFEQHCEGSYTALHGQLHWSR